MIVPGMPLPQFKTPACVGLDSTDGLGVVSSSDYTGKWLVLYTYPKDFTFVCPTEIVEFDRNLAAFADRGAAVLGASTDNEHSHLAWRRSHPELENLRHPLLFLSPRLAADLGVLHPTAGVALRSTIIRDPEGIVRFVSANDLSVGRSVEEVLRVLDALQTGGLCPASWRRGEPTLSAGTSQIRPA
jgi:alkyl hydroperoxide reductase subunit AhpC